MKIKNKSLNNTNIVENKKIFVNVATRSGKLLKQPKSKPENPGKVNDKVTIVTNNKLLNTINNRRIQDANDLSIENVNGSTVQNGE